MQQNCSVTNQYEPMRMLVKGEMHHILNNLPRSLILINFNQLPFWKSSFETVSDETCRGRNYDRAAVMMHRDMMLAVRDRISKMIKDGKSEADVIAAKPWADFDSKVPQSDAKVGNTNQLVAQRFATQVYAELKPAR
jgi:hypothetical protein